jgi:TonB-linked SusC/RagA family outer membrane protein
MHGATPGRRLCAGLLTALLLLGGTAARASAQGTGRVEGTVKEARSGQPISDATVRVVGTTLGARTDGAGKFVIVSVPAGARQLEVRRIGFKNRTVPVAVAVGATVTAAITLTESAVSLDEVVVTGTAAVTRAREVPTSTDIVNADQFKRLPVADAQGALVGRVPSLMVSANSGQPGSGGTVKIRGTNTITQSTDPLIYVDGVRIFNELTRNNWGARTASSPLQNINSDDIERIEVVKGAAATTLYGTEASGGVIQIFTKRGSGGGTRWSATATSGFNVSSRWGAENDPTQLFTACSGTMYDLKNSGSKIGQREYFVDPTCPSDGNWTQPGPIQQYDLSVRGGAERVSYYVSGHYGNVAGVLETQKSRDGGFRGNFNFAPLQKLSFTLNTAYTRRNTRSAGDGNNSEGFLLNVGRGSKNYLKGGKQGECDRWAGTDTVCVTNRYVFDQSLLTRSDHFLTGFTTSWVPNEHLSNRFTVGWDYTDMQNVTNLPFGFITLPEGYFWDENTRHTKLSLDYAGTFQSDFNLAGAIVSKSSWGGQLFRDHHRWTELDVQRFAGPGDPTLETGAELTYRADLPSSETNAGLFLQQELGWRDQLFLTAGLRVDGNSAFGENFGLQAYPKIGASYVLSDYDFWPKDWWDTFKVRLALGESGKAPGAFDKLRTWSPITGDENKPGFTPGNVGNADVGPERTRELEGGVDASFLGGRLGVEVTAFNARTYDALVPVMLPPSQGFLQARLSNIGELRNHGLEMQVNATVLQRSAFDWRVRGNYSRQHSKAVDLGAQTEVYTGLNSYIKTGKEFPAYYGKVVLNPNEIADPQIATDSEIGLVNPNTMWGVGTTVGIGRSVTVDAFLDHQGGYYVQNYTGYQNARRGAWYPCYDTQEKTVASWGPDGKANTADDDPGQLAGITALQRARCSFKSPDIGYWTEKADFTKLRYISVTALLPQRWIRANTASLTLAARNLFTWTDYTGSDPEVQDVSDQANLVGTAGRFGRRDYYQIPQPRTYTISLRVEF